MAFVGGWKAQGLEDHVQVAWVEQAQNLLQAHRAMVVGRKKGNERSVLSSNKEFSSQLQETNDFEIAQLLRLIPGPAVSVLFLVLRHLLCRMSLLETFSLTVRFQSRSRFFTILLMSFLHKR